MESITIPALMAATFCYLLGTVALLSQQQAILTRKDKSDLLKSPNLAAHTEMVHIASESNFATCSWGHAGWFFFTCTNGLFVSIENLRTACEILIFHLAKNYDFCQLYFWETCYQQSFYIQMGQLLQLLGLNIPPNKQMMKMVCAEKLMLPSYIIIIILVYWTHQ